MGHRTDEDELLRASLAGNREAFGAIIQRYQSLVCAITYSATGDIGKSEDLAQETFLRAWRGLGQLDDLGKFRAWLCTIARNLVRQSIRDRFRDVNDTAEDLEKADSLTASAPDPGQAAIDKERREIVWAAVGRVPQKYREPLVLFYREQQSVSQVAADLGLSEPIVRQRLHRGRQYIQAEVASLVEDTLARSGPSKAFAIAVVAALPAITAPTASAAVAGMVAKGTPAAKTVLGVSLSGATLGSIIGLLGGILGWAIGLLGGIVGTRAGIRRAKSPRERRFVVRLGLFVWLLVIVLIALPQILLIAGMISMWVYLSCWSAFFLILLPLIFWSNARQQRIQIEDGTHHPPEPPLQSAAQLGPRQSFVGKVFGPLIWVLIPAAITGDWITAFVVFALGFVVLFITRRVSAAWPERPFLSLLVALLGVGAIDLGVVCLRWRAWQQVAAFNEIGGVVPFWIVALIIVGFVAAGAIVAIVMDRRRSTPPIHAPDARHASRSGVFGALVGAVFGSTAWLSMMTLAARDWVAFVVVALYAIVVFLISARICATRPHRLWPVLLTDVAVLYVLHLLVLNLRWSRWMASFEHTGHQSLYREVSLTEVNVIVAAVAVAEALIFGLRWAADRRWHRAER
jgi:RNA polymerase sigma factor (sigma-70 family)